MDAKKAYQFVGYQKVLYLSILQMEICWDISCCIPSLWLYIDLTSIIPELHVNYVFNKNKFQHEKE
jgi:hypothetical protein